MNKDYLVREVGTSFILRHKLIERTQKLQEEVRLLEDEKGILMSPPPLLSKTEETFSIGASDLAHFASTISKKPARKRSHEMPSLSKVSPKQNRYGTWDVPKVESRLSFKSEGLLPAFPASSNLGLSKSFTDSTFVGSKRYSTDDFGTTNNGPSKRNSTGSTNGLNKRSSTENNSSLGSTKRNSTDNKFVTGNKSTDYSKNPNVRFEQHKNAPHGGASKPGAATKRLMKERRPSSSSTDSAETVRNLENGICVPSLDPYVAKSQVSEFRSFQNSTQGACPPPASSWQKNDNFARYPESLGQPSPQRSDANSDFPRQNKSPNKSRTRRLSGKNPSTQCPDPSSSKPLIRAPSFQGQWSGNSMQPPPSLPVQEEHGYAKLLQVRGKNRSFMIWPYRMSHAILNSL